MDTHGGRTVTDQTGGYNLIRAFEHITCARRDPALTPRLPGEEIRE